MKLEFFGLVWHLKGTFVDFHENCFFGGATKKQTCYRCYLPLYSTCWLPGILILAYHEPEKMSGKIPCIDFQKKYLIFQGVSPLNGLFRIISELYWDVHGT